ncbi:hypothetical protein C8Q76DRAFT_790761 [Earliella scabrosa]|nr:hypothetical protein C8Q76DRAFT_790761 [Earliella scabrosa]
MVFVPILDAIILTRMSLRFIAPLVASLVILTGSSPALTMLDPRKPVHAEPRAEQAVLVPGDAEVLDLGLSPWGSTTCCSIFLPAYFTPKLHIL